jgi:hypothetical protein
MRTMIGGLALAAALMLGAAPPALAGEGRTVITTVNPIEHSKDGDICQATFAVELDGQGGAVAGGAIGVFGGAQPGLMLKVGIDANGAASEPATAVVLTSAGDNAAAQFHAESSESDPGYKLFMFTVDRPVMEVLARNPIRLALTLKPGGPVSVIAIDLSRSADPAGNPVADPGQPQRFADCLAAMK